MTFPSQHNKHPLCVVIPVKEKKNPQELHCNKGQCRLIAASEGSTCEVRLTKVAVKLPLWVGNYTGAAVRFPNAALNNSWQPSRYRHQQVGTAANQPHAFI